MENELKELQEEREELRRELREVADQLFEIKQKINTRGIHVNEMAQLVEERKDLVARHNQIEDDLRENKQDIHALKPNGGDFNHIVMLVAAHRARGAEATTGKLYRVAKDELDALKRLHANGSKT